MRTSLSRRAGTLRVATWNMKSVAPRISGPTGTEQIWSWAANNLDADVYVFTEAKVPKTGLPQGWNALYVPGGVGSRRPWGTVIASPRRELRASNPIRMVLEEGEADCELPHPAVTHSADILVDGSHWATIVGAYGFTPESKDGSDALLGIVCETMDVLNSHDHPVIVAGDFNLHPDGLIEVFHELEMTDVLTLAKAPKRLDGVNGTRRWTHRNTNNPGATVQELDFIFVSDDLAERLVGVLAGIEDFPDAFDVSDHAPVLADFEL